MSEKKKEKLHAVTSEAGKWNKPRKSKLSPKKAQDLSFKKFKGTEMDQPHEKSCKTTGSKRLFTVANVKQVDVQKFAARLREITPNAAFLLGIEQPTPQKIQAKSQKLPNLHNVDFLYANNTDLKSEMCQSHFNRYFKSLTLSENQCCDIEEKTRGQINNDNWKSARHGRLTSSNFGPIWMLSNTTPPDHTIKRIMGYSEFDSKELRWGRQHERAACRVYRHKVQKTHPGLKVHSCGLLVRPDLPYLGSSPNALLYCQHCNDSEGVLEIKCPFSARFLTPKEAAQQKGFFCTLEENDVRLRRNHPYYFQVQGQLAISGRKWCDFFVWTLKGCSVERIFFDETTWNSLLQKLTKFYTSAVIPELFSERIKRGLPLFP